MYDPDRDYERDERQSITAKHDGRYADVFERPVWCMRCGVQVDEYDWAVVVQAVFCQKCVNAGPKRCLDSIRCLRPISWDGIMKVAHGLLWLSPDDPVYCGYAAEDIARWLQREKRGDTFYGDGPFKGRRLSDQQRSDDVASSSF